MTGERTAEVVLTGELDITTYEDAEKQVTDAEQATPALLIIDLAGLQFVDSTGVRLILAANYRRAARTSGAAARCARHRSSGAVSTGRSSSARAMSA